MKHVRPEAHYPALTDAMVVSLIDLLGSDGFIDGLAAKLDTEFGFDHFHVFLYSEALAPAALASRPSPTPYARGLQNYLTYTYVINPAYRAFRQGVPSGVYMISDFMQNDNAGVLEEHDLDVHIEESEPIGYRTPGWPRNMAEVIVLVNLPNGTALDFSFMAPLGSGRAAACKASVERLFPFLDALLLRQFAIDPNSLVARHESAGQEDRFNDFGGDALTAREREVAQLILVGHSSKSISLNLGISLPTVKTHRRNIYSKLQISSQAELFNLFLLHLK